MATAPALPNIPPLKSQASSSPKNQNFSNLSLLSLCHHLQEAKQVHALMIKSSQISDPFSACRLAEFYAVSDNGDLELAQMVVDSIEIPNTFAWNTLIRGHLKRRNFRKAVMVHEQMLRKSAQPDPFTLTLILKACAELKVSGIGRQFHSQILKWGLEQNTAVQNKLVHVYSVSESMADAVKAFDNCSQKDIVTWNTLLEGYSHNGDGKALQKVFDEMPVRDTVSWNTLIAYYVRQGDYKEAVETFRTMEKNGERVDKVTLISALTAVSHLGALGLGQWVHACLTRWKFDLDENLASALVYMYAKCGCMEGAVHVFSGTKRKSVDTWNALFSGLAMNGQTSKVIGLFSKMQASNVTPNAITFSAILNACSHGGLVEEGLRFFDKMKTDYGIDPDIVHYGCLVDLLGRAGLFDKIREVIKSMPVQPDKILWKSLLSACRMHKRFDIAQEMGHHLIELAPDDDALFVLLSNVFAVSGNWAMVDELRKRMREEGIRKQPGSSSIEVDGVVHEFIAGDTSHFRRDEIYEMLDEMLTRLELAGYQPDKEQLLLNIDEEDKKYASLSHHSEKIALAFGLISTAPGTTIRVVKNLRVCSDCHSAFKLLSGIYDREIIVRDSNRFHHFGAGSCSCKDYW